jgi:3-methyl-2-oxobutanoate hydroxymethyltransferase
VYNHIIIYILLKTPKKERGMAKNRVTIDYLYSKKQRGEKITRVVLWDYPMALLADSAGVDMILVGDSVGMVILGYPNTIPVTMEEMIHHCKAVTRGRERCLVVGDLPFMSYEASTDQAVRNAGRLVKEGGVDAVKIEGGQHLAETAYAICKAGIPVHGHIGLTPQRVKQLGGFKVQGKTVQSAVDLFKDASALAEAGCFAITLECAPPILGRLISEGLASVIVISAGSGPDCDGQSVNLYDMVGLTQRSSPRFVKRYSEVGSTIKSSIQQFCQETQRGTFPAKEHCYNIESELSAEISRAIEDMARGS